MIQRLILVIAVLGVALGTWVASQMKPAQATPPSVETAQSATKEKAPMGSVQPGKDDEDAPKEFTTTDSGLKYKVLRKGNGKKPKASNSVVCHYKGWTDDGKEFDSSYKRGETIEFPLNGVIKGWTEGMQHVEEGGKIELEIPYALGYGERGIPGTIPPKATLHFIVELHKIK